MAIRQTLAAALALGAGLIAGPATASAQSAAVKPNLVCAPGGGCGTPQYFEYYSTISGSNGTQTANLQVETLTSSGGKTEVLGCVAGIVGTAAELYLTDGMSAILTADTTGYYWTAQCGIGTVLGWIGSW